MEVVTIVVAALSILLLLCQLICGSWIRSKGADAGGKRFHSRLGIANVLTGIATAILAIIVAS